MKVNNLTLRKILRKDSVLRISFFIRGILLLICFLLLVWVFIKGAQSVISVTSIIEDLNHDVSLRVNKIQESNEERAKEQDYSPLKKVAYFGALGEDARPKSKKEEKKKTEDIPLELIGTFVFDADSPWAIIKDKKNKVEEIFKLQDSVFEAATLVNIYSDSVEIMKDGQLKTLSIDFEGGGVSSGAKVSGNFDKVEVEESALEEALGNLPLLLTQARAVPYFKSGKSIGLRMFAIKRGSLFEKIGLKNGDILKTINENSLGDITQAVKLFEKLKEEKEISLVMERNRKEKTVVYKIK